MNVLTFLHKTKNNRELVVELPENGLAERALVCLLKYAQPGHSLFGETYRIVYMFLKEFEQELGLALRLTPHSLRAGGATALRLAGKSVPEITERGRWASIEACRSYIDILFLRLPSIRRQISHTARVRETEVKIFVPKY